VAYLLDHAADMTGQRVTVAGWVKSVRSQSTRTFVALSDGSCQRDLQIVVDPSAEGYAALSSASTGASLKFTGTVVESPAKGQEVELKVEQEPGDAVTLLGGVDGESYPLQKKRMGPEYLRTVAHLRPRTNLIGGSMRVRSALSQAIHAFFQKRGFQYVHTPCITGSDCEGAGEMFQVTTLLDSGEGKPTLPEKDAKEGGGVDYAKDFFGKPVFLTVSGQLAVENYASALSDVYTFGPTFRAENSQTSRHLAEFWMVEPELAFADMGDAMQCAEDLLKTSVRHVLDTARDDLEFFDLRVEKGLVARLEKLVAEPFARVSYTEAIEKLKENEEAFSVPVEWGMDLPSEMERFLTEKLYEKPVVVYNYPKGIKAFYMRLNDDDKTVAAFDVLVPGVGELVGGSQREERLGVLEARMRESGLDPEAYAWYADLRRYGSVVHSGFGVGLERLVMLVTGITNIRDVIPYPRYPGHADY
jgi:asparaginyl-tRNA synthetase